MPLKQVVRLHASSGTTGKPIVVGYTWNDSTGKAKRVIDNRQNEGL